MTKENVFPSLQYIREPHLEFRYGQKVLDPKLGLAIFGPYDDGEPSHPKNISYAVIGTKEGNHLASIFFKRIQSTVKSETASNNEKLWPVFPSFQAVYNSSLLSTPTKAVEIDRNKLLSSSNNLDPHKRAYEIVNQYLAGIKQAIIQDDPIDVIICIVPDIVYKNCRPKSSLSVGIGERVSASDRRQRASGQQGLFDSYNPKVYQYSRDFRRQLKARAMEECIDPPIQIILESTLNVNKETDSEVIDKTPLSDRAWNICTTLFYKAGGKPWRLGTARDGVCYVGVVFRKTDISLGSQTACCAAQMFLDDGDGVVIRGDTGPWFSKDRGFHLTKEASKALLSKVLRTYSTLGGKPLKEIFLHYRAFISSREYEGFRAACPKSAKLVCIRIRQEPNEIRLYREGKWPVLRG